MSKEEPPQTITHEGETWAVVGTGRDERGYVPERELCDVIRMPDGRIVSAWESHGVGWYAGTIDAGASLYRKRPVEPQVIELEVETDGDGMPVSIYGVTGKPNAKYRAVLIPEGMTNREAWDQVFSGAHTEEGQDGR